MTPRSIRRAVERKAKKLARKADATSALAPAQISSPEVLSDQPALPNQAKTLSSQEPTLFTAPISQTNLLSNAKLNANRANAQLSTGPTTAQGKAKACLNAVKTALTGRTVQSAFPLSKWPSTHKAAFSLPLASTIMTLPSVPA